MSDALTDDFMWLPVQSGDEYFITMEYYIQSGAKPVLVGPFGSAQEALTEAEARNKEQS
jgi:hypothetical protein